MLAAGGELLLRDTALLRPPPVWFGLLQCDADGAEVFLLSLLPYVGGELLLRVTALLQLARVWFGLPPCSYGASYPLMVLTPCFVPSRCAGGELLLRNIAVCDLPLCECALALVPSMDALKRFLWRVGTFVGGYPMDRS